MSRRTLEPFRANSARVVTRVAGGLLQRKCACIETRESECDECKKKQLALQRSPAPGARMSGVPAVVHDALRGPGQPIDARARASMERSFRHDFSSVRVHTDRLADESARAVNALAYTSGRDIVFGAGQYAPGTRRGDSLIAHELTHVVQQRGSVAPPSGIDADAGAEREADRIAKEDHGGGVRESAPGSIQRQQAQPGANSGYFTDAPIEETAGCVQPYTGESLEAALKPGTVTVFEFSATWCGPCKTLARFMGQECTKHKSDKKPMRFFSIDIDKSKKLGDQYAKGNVPQLYVYDGTKQVYHGTDVRPMDFYAKLFDSLTTTAAAKEPEEKGTSGIPRLALGAIFGAGTALAVGGALGIAAAAGAHLTAGVVGAALGGAFLGGAVFGLLDPFGLSKRTKAVGASEADALIRKRFGQYLPKPAEGAAPLHDATIHPVTQDELKAVWKCRHPKEEPGSTLVGWTDQGPEDPSAEQEPVCESKKKLERASFDKPVVYFATDHPDATVLVHEGLHTYEHPSFSQKLRNFASEGATEYFSQQIEDDIRMSSSSGYGDQVQEIRKLVDVIGEDALRKAFFKGDFGPADAVLGKCGLQEWALNLQMGQFSAAGDVLKKQKKNYCPGGDGEK